MDAAAPSAVAPEAVLEGIAEACCALDLQGRFSYVNAAAASMFGAAPGDLLGRRPWEVWRASVGAILRDAVTRVARTGEAQDVTMRVPGTRAWAAGKVGPIPGGVACVFHDITAQKSAEGLLARLAAGHAAVRRVAEAVAEGAIPERVHALVAHEAGALLRAHVSALMAFEDDLEGATVLASWRDGGAPAFRHGERVPLPPHSTVRTVRRTGQPRLDAGIRPDAETPWGRIGCRAIAAVPIHADGRLWGALALGWLREDPDPDVARKLTDFSKLIALALGNAAARSRLAEQASTDALTGLLNHRAFHERLREEVERARRYDRPLSLALLDLDSFKPINDSQGHQAGDALLARIAERLRTEVRAHDVVARIGGDEFALLMPETAGEAALMAVEQLRVRLGEVEIGGQGVTTSAGVCDLRHAGGPGDLYRLADGALYWSKAHGRDTACLYDPEVVRELSAQERADALARSQALVGLRGLARAIDAKDPSTRRHSARVADLAQMLAEELGWSRDRVALLREAALLHDVGKIGVPDAVLLKPTRLTLDEYEVVKEHAALGAKIVDELLSAEQVAWVRSHHERPDGAGYPDGLVADAIPDGARVLAVADAYDVMVSARPYSRPKPPAEAASEIGHLAGSQFDPAVSSALAALHARGALA